MLSWVGFGGIVAAAVLYSEETAFPGVAALLPVLATVAVLVGGATAGRHGAVLLLGRAPLQWIGERSYGWYLWHWPLVVIVPAALGTASLTVGIAASAVGLVLAALTYRFVENPVRHHGWFKGGARRGLAFGLGVSLATAGFAYTFGGHPPAIASGDPAKDPTIGATADPLVALRRFLDAPPEEVPSNLEPALDRVKSEKSRLYQLGCHGTYAATAVQPCVFGDRDSERSVVLFGDSHAAQWYPALEEIARLRHWRLVTLTKSSCKIAAVETVINGGPYKACDQWREGAFQVMRAEHPDLVVMASSTAAGLVPGQGPREQAWRTGFEQIIGRVRATGARPVIIQDTPWPVGDIPECLSLHPRSVAACTTTRQAAQHDPDVRRALRAAAKSTGTRLIDPTPWFCTAAGRCPPIIGNVLVYSDANHITLRMSRLLAPLLARRLR
ncbi:hypothetical protein GCM10027589_10040 [Actinocorallia lasiicapitis]